MSNMTIQNVSGFLESGNMGRIMDRGAQVEGQSIQNPVAPEMNPSEATTKSFGQMLGDSLDKVNEMQGQADLAAKELSAGRNKNIHETMLLLEKADMSFRLAMQVRNKVIDAYREIIRMQV